MSSDFRGFDMMQEPEPRWPEWLNKWYRQAEPKRGSFVTEFDRVMREVYSEWREQFNSSSFFAIGIKTEYRTPPEQQRRIDRRAAERVLRD